MERAALIVVVCHLVELSAALLDENRARVLPNPLKTLARATERVEVLGGLKGSHLSVVSVGSALIT